MKKLLAALAVTAAIGIAAPASAYAARDNDRGGHAQESYRGAPNFAQQLQQLEQRVHVGARRGDLNRWEARRFTADIRAIDNLRVSYRRSNGFSPREVRDLDRRIENLRVVINREIRDDRYADRGWDRR